MVLLPRGFASVPVIAQARHYAGLRACPSESSRPVPAYLFAQRRLNGVLGSSASVGVGGQSVMAVGADAVVFLARLFYRIDVYDGTVQVAQVVQ